MLIRFNKPYGVLTQFRHPWTDKCRERQDAGSDRDKDGRPTLADHIKVPDVYPAGRLDHDSEGLLLLTDDGRLQHRLSDPVHKLPKTYWAQVEGEPDLAAIDQLRRGVLIDGSRTLPAEVRRIPEPALWPRDPPIRFRQSIPAVWIEIVLSEGRNRQVRRMTAAVGHPTLRLVRVAIGPYTVEDLPPGTWREADPALVKWQGDPETERGGDYRTRRNVPAGQEGRGRRDRAHSPRRPSR
ncbi:MAG: pseudouridine synthase [Pseudomonadota bacterium]